MALGMVIVVILVGVLWYNYGPDYGSSADNTSSGYSDNSCENLCGSTPIIPKYSPQSSPEMSDNNMSESKAIKVPVITPLTERTNLALNVRIIFDNFAQLIGSCKDKTIALPIKASVWANDCAPLHSWLNSEDNAMILGKEACQKNYLNYLYRSPIIVGLIKEYLEIK